MTLRTVTLTAWRSCSVARWRRVSCLYVATSWHCAMEEGSARWCTLPYVECVCLCTFGLFVRLFTQPVSYPVPNPAFPFLGTHITKKLDGSVWFGPNAMLAFAREGYSLRTINLRDLAETVTHRGLIKLALRNWRWCASELHSGLRFVADPAK